MLLILTHLIIQNVSSPAALLVRNTAESGLSEFVQIGCLNWCSDEIFIDLAGDAAEGVWLHTPDDEGADGYTNNDAWYDPRHERQQPPEAVAGGESAHGAISVSHATISPRRSGGPSTSAWSRKPSTSDRKPARLVTGTEKTTEPSGCSRLSRSSPSWWRAGPT